MKKGKFVHMTIRGSNNHITKKETRYATNFFGRILLGPNLQNRISIELKYKLLGKNALGFCTPIDDEDYKKHREFEILIAKDISRAMVLRTLAHEMVHVMQFARGHHRVYDDRTYKWMGKRIIIESEDYNKEYENMPWEIEARDSENYLLDFYRQHCKNNDVKF